jgi:hypothetical protein
VNSSEIMSVAAAAAASSNSVSNPLSNHEEHAVRQLISGEELCKILCRIEIGFKMVLMAPNYHIC